MNVLDEIKDVIEVRVDIDEQKLSDKLFDHAVDPLLLKLVELIPTEIDNAFYAGKKEELRLLFTALLTKEVEKLEDKIDSALGQDEQGE